MRMPPKVAALILGHCPRCPNHEFWFLQRVLFEVNFKQITINPFISIFINIPEITIFPRGISINYLVFFIWEIHNDSCPSVPFVGNPIPIKYLSPFDLRDSKPKSCIVLVNAASGFGLKLFSLQKLR